MGFLSLIGVVELAGSLALGLYPLYSVAAASGWISGNIYVPRSRGLPSQVRRRLFIVYFVGPPGLLYLLRAMAPADVQAAAPVVPLYSFGVFAVLFMVPVALRSTVPHGRLKAGDRKEDDRDRGEW